MNNPLYELPTEEATFLVDLQSNDTTTPASTHKNPIVFPLICVCLNLSSPNANLDKFEQIGGNNSLLKVDYDAPWNAVTETASLDLEFIDDVCPTEMGSGVSDSLDGNLVADFLAQAGAVPDRKSITEDDSLLLEYFNNRFACVDIYPSGEIIVLIRKGKNKDVYELDMSKLSEVANLVKNGELKS